MENKLLNEFIDKRYDMIQAAFDYDGKIAYRSRRDFIESVIDENINEIRGAVCFARYSDLIDMCEFEDLMKQTRSMGIALKGKLVDIDE